MSSLCPSLACEQQQLFTSWCPWGGGGGGSCAIRARGGGSPQEDCPTGASGPPSALPDSFPAAAHPRTVARKHGTFLKSLEVHIFLPFQPLLAHGKRSLPARPLVCVVWRAALPCGRAPPQESRTSDHFCAAVSKKEPATGRVDRPPLLRMEPS